MNSKDKNNKPKYRRKRNEQRDNGQIEEKDVKSNGCNDISWYAQDAQLLSDAASLPWSTQTGIMYSHQTELYDQGTQYTGLQNESIPGILAMQMMTGPGKTAIDLDAANVAANAIYTNIRHMNSGHSNYDAPDLMHYLLQMDDIFTMINWLMRIYGTIFSYNIFNRYTPKALLIAQRVDPDSIMNNIVGFRTRLNMIIKQAATLVVPNNLPIYFRHSWLFQNYYIEGTDIKDQIYMYYPATFRVLDTVAQPAVLEPLTFEATDGSTSYCINNTKLYDVFKLLDVLQTMVSQLYLSEDFGIMAGDILKAYGEGGIMRLSEVPEQYVTPIIPNNEVLLQFKNSIVLNSAYQMLSGQTIWNRIMTDPTTNSIYWETTIPNVSAAAWKEVGYELLLNNVRVLTMEGAPSPALNMIMTRNMSYVIWDRSGQVPAPGAQIYCGTEIAICCMIYDFRLDNNGDVVPTGHDFHTVSVGYSTRTQGVSPWPERAALLSNFKYHPQVYFVVLDTANSTYVVHRLYQVDNFTYITNEELDRMHAVAIMSEFNIPTMALVK